MSEPLHCYVGWDPLDVDAYRVCEDTLRKNSSIPLKVMPLKDMDLRRQGVLWRPYMVEGNGQKIDMIDGKPFSTGFSFSRFAVPILEQDESNICVFMDPDMLWRGDIAEMLEHCKEDFPVYCVQHNQIAKEGEMKMGGMVQTMYARKNWSSLMVIRPYLCREMTKYALNNKSGTWLHSLAWAGEKIGSIPQEWNWLEGYSDPEIDPKVIHYTRGTPDLPDCKGVDKADLWWAAYRDLENPYVRKVA